MKKTIEILNAGLDEAKRRVKYARENVQKMKSQRRVLSRIVSMVCKGLNDKDTIAVTATGDIYINMRELSGFKCAELEMVLTALENLGECIETSDWAELYNRDFLYKINGIYVHLHTYVKTDSETCKRVVVGTEIVEKPKYQLVCD